MQRTFALLVMLLLCLLMTGLAQALNTEGLVLYMPFDEGNGQETADLSGNENNGTLEGDAEWVDGHIGSGIYLANASDLVNVPDSPTLDIEE